MVHGQSLYLLPQLLSLRLLNTLQPGTQQLLQGQVAPETLQVVGVLLATPLGPGDPRDVVPHPPGLQRHVLLEYDKLLTVAGRDLHVQAVHLPVHQLPRDDDLRAIEVVGEQGPGGMLYQAGWIIHADVREERGPDLIVEPGEEEQRGRIGACTSYRQVTS